MEGQQKNTLLLTKNTNPSKRPGWLRVSNLEVQLNQLHVLVVSEALIMLVLGRFNLGWKWNVFRENKIMLQIIEKLKGPTSWYTQVNVIYITHHIFSHFIMTSLRLRSNPPCRGSRGGFFAAGVLRSQPPVAGQTLRGRRERVFISSATAVNVNSRFWCC